MSSVCERHFIDSAGRGGRRSTGFSCRCHLLGRIEPHDPGADKKGFLGAKRGSSIR